MEPMIRKNFMITDEMQQKINWIMENGKYISESEVLRQGLIRGLPELEATINPGHEEKTSRQG